MEESGSSSVTSASKCHLAIISVRKGISSVVRVLFSTIVRFNNLVSVGKVLSVRGL